MLDFKKNGKPCVYLILNTINNKVYIGSATGHYRRKGQHFYMLRRGIHYNKHLQSSWNKYKENNFKFNVLEFIENVNELVEKEEFYIKKFKATMPKYGYNHRDACNSNLGNKWSKQSKQKFSESKKGKPTGLDYEKIAKINSKPVKGINKTTGKEIIFNSIKEAGEFLKINRTCISKALKGVIKSAGNHYWRYQGLCQEIDNSELSEFRETPEVDNPEPSLQLNAV